MTKQEALKKIDELKAFVEECDKPKKLVMTMADDDEIHLNGKWAMSLWKQECEGDCYRGSKVSGHEASLYLTDCHGTWYTEDGNNIRGYLFYKPDNEH